MLTAGNLAIVTSLAALSFVVQSVTTRLFLGTPKPIERKNALKKSLRYLLHRVSACLPHSSATRRPFAIAEGPPASSC
eukprot:54405-Eustigmatos_ZCMA.PRE.1